LPDTPPLSVLHATRLPDTPARNAVASGRLDRTLLSAPKDPVMSRTFRLAVPLLAFAALCSAAEEPAKPACTAQLRGKLWPEKTSRGADVPVEICAPKRFHYAWQQLTIDVSHLRAATRRKEVVASLPAVEGSRARR
jgi:hypothetical protein